MSKYQVRYQLYKENVMPRSALGYWVAFLAVVSLLVYQLWHLLPALH